MSAVFLALLLTAVVAAVVVGAAALFALRTLRRQVAALRVEWSPAAVPAARTPGSAETAAVPTAVDPGRAAEAAALRRTEIREAVTEALAEERERELAEARAFWAAQEAREAADAPFLEEGRAEGAEGSFHYSRQIEIAPLSAEGRGRFDQQFTDALREAIDELVRDAEAEIDGDSVFEAGPRSGTGAGAGAGTGTGAGEPSEAVESADGAALPAVGGDGAVPVPGTDADPADPARAAVPDMRRHPSHPDFRPSPAVADTARTNERLERLAAAGTPLTDVRPGPLGTLDIYVFADGTSLCVTPGDPVATQRLCEALHPDRKALLVGGSGIGGGYALTFGIGEETVYVLADRVVASF